MSDSRLRDLERAFRESAAVEDEVAWHAERLRLGLVSEDQLVLAASFGHAAACELVGVQDRPLRKLPFSQLPQAAYSWPLPLEITQRCLLAALAAEPWEYTVRGPLAVALQAVEARVLNPGTGGEALRRATSYDSLPVDPFGTFTILQLTLEEVLRDLGREWEPESFSLDSQAAVVSALDSLAQRRGAFPYEAIEAELSLWLLGLSDGLRERVEGRSAQGGPDG